MIYNKDTCNRLKEKVKHLILFGSGTMTETRVQERDTSSSLLNLVFRIN